MLILRMLEIYISSSGKRGTYHKIELKAIGVTNLNVSSNTEVFPSLDLLIYTCLICRHDIIAQIYYARRLAEKLHPFAKMVDLHGGHLVSHERTEEVPVCLDV